jgi:hypothetical protein
MVGIVEQGVEVGPDQFPIADKTLFGKNRQRRSVAASI